MGGLECGDIVFRIAAALQAHAVDHARFGATAACSDHHHERRNIGRNACHAADKRMSPDGDEVVYGAVAAHVDVVFQVDVPGELHIVRNNATVSDAAIVGHMDPDEKQVPIADGGHTAAVARAGVGRDHFAENVFLTDIEPRLLSGILDVLRRGSQDSLRENLASFAERCVTIDGYLVVDFATISKDHVGTDHGIGSDLYVLADLGAGLDDGGWVNAHSNALLLQGSAGLRVSQHELNFRLGDEFVPDRRSPFDVPGRRADANRFRLQYKLIARPDGAAEFHLVQAE